MTKENPKPKGLKRLFGRLYFSKDSRLKDRAWWRWALYQIGVHVPSDRSWAVYLRPRFFAFFAGGFLLAILGMGGMTVYSTSPNFCKSCHIMQPYYDAWQGSAHKDVSCVKCHYPPGDAKEILWLKFQAMSQVAKFVTRTYSSKPYAEVEDASCLRSGCHSKRLLEGRIETKDLKVKIKFDHRPHLLEKRRGRQLKCVSCHSQMVMGKHVEVTWDTCYLCHFKGKGEGRDLKPLGGCLGCHDMPREPIQIGDISYDHKDFVVKRGLACSNCHMDVLRGTGEAKQDRCFTCHNEPDKIKKFDDIPFLHENHVTKHNVACFHCHSEMQHGTSDAKGSKMARIHEVKGEESADGEPSAKPHMTALKFECSYCHTDTHGGQLEMYSGNVSGLGLRDIPSPMYLAHVGCIGCHYQDGGEKKDEFNGKTLLSSKQSCVKCHGKEFGGIWEETKTELAGTKRKLKKKLDAARAALASAAADEAGKKAAESKIRTAERWHHFVEAAHGEHNIYLASDVLRRENEELKEAGKLLGASLPDVSDDPLISGSYCATMCHTRVGVRVPPETVRVDGKAMPHKMHAEMGGCVKCHDIGKHKQVRLRKNVKQEVCSECHGG